jgi:hypothetical protein
MKQKNQCDKNKSNLNDELQKNTPDFQNLNKNKLGKRIQGISFINKNISKIKSRKSIFYNKESKDKINLRRASSFNLSYQSTILKFKIILSESPINRTKTKEIRTRIQF